MHINVTIGLIGFIGGLSEIIRSLIHAMNHDMALLHSRTLSTPRMHWFSIGSDFAIAMTSKVLMTGLLLIYVILCLRSFIAARRAREV